MSTKTKKAPKGKAGLKTIKKSVPAGVQRELKYAYPADVISKEDRKKFRREVRAKLAKLEKAASSKDAKREAKSDLAKFKETVYA